MTAEADWDQAVYEAMARQARQGDIVADALIAWGVYTGVGFARKVQVWRMYLETVGVPVS